MISAYRAGLSAGSTAFHARTTSLQYDVRRLAQETLERRKRLGIAHYVPETDFLQGFLEGYEQHTEKPDGLCLAEQNEKRELA